MNQVGLLPVMALNLAKNSGSLGANGTMFVMHPDILSEQLIDKVNNLDENTVQYFLDNSIYRAGGVMLPSSSGQNVDLSLSNLAAPYQGITGEEYNISLTDVKFHATSGSTVLENLSNLKVYCPKYFGQQVSVQPANNAVVSVPAGAVAAGAVSYSLHPEPFNDLNGMSVVNTGLEAVAVLTTGYYSGGANSRADIHEVVYREAIETDIAVFKVLWTQSYRINWASLRLRIWYFDEIAGTWSQCGAGAFVLSSSATAYRFPSVTAKRFRFYVDGYFDSSSGGNSTTLSLSKFSLCKENSTVEPITYVPTTAVFFGYNTTMGTAVLKNKFPLAKSINAIIYELGATSGGISILNRSDAFLDNTTLATLPLDNSVDSTSTKVFATSLVDMENALTYIANNNYLGRKVVNNSGAFSAHGPLNAAFSATLDAGVGRQWHMKDIVIKDNAVAVPTYPNNPRVHWYVSNDNVTYVPLFVAESATGERVINLSAEVFARFVRIQHDTHPSNTYSLSAAIYSDNSLSMYERANVVATGNPFAYSAIAWTDTGIFLPDVNNSNPYKGHATLADEVYDFGEEVNIVSFTTRASAGNPGSYPSAPFKIYKKVAGEWILAYTQPNTSSVEVVHSLNFLATAIKFEWVGNLFVKPTQYLAVQTLNSPVGRFGKAAKGDGSTTKINTGINITALDNWSVSFHANNLMSGSGSIVGATKGSGLIPKFVLNMNDVVAGRLTLSVISQAGVNIVGTANAFTDNNFHHLVLNCTDRIVSLYIDGTFAFTINNILGQALNPLTFLSEGENWKFFNGAIDQVRVFSRALAVSEINALTNELIPSTGTGNEGELAFDTAFLKGSRGLLLPNQNRIGATI